MNKPIVIAGPCQHENYEHSFNIAKHCQEICDKHGIEYYFKASFDKANRTFMNSPRGKGISECFNDFWKLRDDFKMTTDFHETEQIDKLPMDVIQIPAFLSKQTDLLLKAASTGKIVNVKKGQFMPPGGVSGIISKIGDKNVWVTERGSSFGYGRMIIDFEGIQYMKDNYNVPIFLDITHSISDRKYAKTMAGLAGNMGLNLFVEVHDDPDYAPSDGNKMIYLDQFEDVIKHYYTSFK
jgi:2-dehydro-3-deoxyphosphooctonate aldolase (KDO 8-P synthase)